MVIQVMQGRQMLTATTDKHAMKPDDNTESIDAVNTEQELSTEVSGMESHDEVDHGESDTEEVPQEEDRHVSTSDPGSMDMGSSKDDQTADNPTSTPDSAQDASSSSGDIQSPRPQTPDGTENSAVEKPDEAHDDAVAPSPSTGCMLQENEKVNSTAREATDDAVEKEITTDETSSGEQDGQDSTQENDTAAAADVKELNAEQEKNLIRSALRLSELDGEDAELLSDFLTRAQAKRAANAALTPRETDKAVISDSPTPRARRALGELDGNSPSPQKPSPSKAASSPEAEKTDDQQSATPGCRRSSRTRAAKQQEQAVPNRIPLRRANGTELVFLPRTEAQELALTTRRNTRRNKGDAQLPRIALQAMAQKQEAEQAESEGSAEESQRRSKRAGGKQVSWNEQRLVEYAHDDVPVEPAPAASAARAPRRPPTGAKSAAAPALPRASSTTKPSTPVGQRKKLTPKSPSAALLGTPASKAIGKAAVKTGTTSSSRSSSSSSKTAAGVKKSSSILKAGAGSTPMPKRVRAAKK